MKLAEFDAVRFVADVEAALEKRGPGSRELMRQRTGLSAGSLSYMFRERAVSNIEIIMSLAWYLDLKPIAYIKRNPFQRLPKKPGSRWASRIYDWALFGACVEMICAGSPAQLAAQVKGLKMNQAAAILKGKGTRSHETMKQICKLLRLDPGVFLRPDRRYKNTTEPIKRCDRKSRRLKLKAA